MLERVIGSVLVGWWSFFNRGNQRSFRTDQLQERVQNHIIDCCWLLFPVTDMVVSITCTNQFGIEALTNPQKDISFRLFLLQSKQNIHPNPTKKTSSSWILVKWCFYRIISSFTGTEERYLLITWFCHPCDTMHAEVPPDDPEHFCPFWPVGQLRWFALKKKTSHRLDRPFGGGNKGGWGWEMFVVVWSFVFFWRNWEKLEMFKVWDDSSQKTFIIFNTWKNKWIEEVFSVGRPHHLIKNWGKPFRLTRSSQEDQRPILTSAMEQRELEAHL